MAFSKGKSTVDTRSIMESINDADLVSFYLGVKKVPCFIHSPLRKDNKPSFGLYSLDGEKILWTDLGTGERGDMIDLLSRMWFCDFKSTLLRIEREMHLENNNTSVQKSSPCSLKEHKSDVNINVKVREWRKYDIEYWESYGIPLSYLKYAEVYPISHKIVEKEGHRYVFGADKYAYVFVERKEGNITLKIYQPFNTNGYKWCSKHDSSVISLWAKLPEYGDKLVICSSLKDALCLWANAKIPAVAPQGEGYRISDTAIKELKRRFKNIFVLFDNDEPGLKDGKKFAEETGFTNIILPQFKGGKDISDMYKSIGKHKFLKIIQDILSTDDTNPFDLPFYY